MSPTHREVEDLLKRFAASLIAVLVAGSMWTSFTFGYVNYDQPTGNTCCFASMAMVVTNATGRRHAPRDIMGEFPYYLTKYGARHSLMHAVAYRYHLVVSYFGPNDHLNGMKPSGGVRAGLRRAARSIPYGAQAVVLFRGKNEFPFRYSHFTSGGHCVVLNRYAHRHFHISDPNRKGRYGDSERRRGWSARALLRRGNVYKLWIFW